MEYQKINFLENTPNQPTKFRTKNWVEMNDESRGINSLIVKLDLKLQCLGQIYVIAVMHIYLLKKQ